MNSSASLPDRKSKWFCDKPKKSPQWSYIKMEPFSVSINALDSYYRITSLTKLCWYFPKFSYFFSDAKYIQRKLRRRNQIQREKRREYEIQHSKRPSKIPSVSSSSPVKKQQSRRPPPLIPNRTNAPPLANRKRPSR